VHEFGGEDGGAARLGDHGGDGESVGFGCEEVAEAGLAGGFARVVAFPGEFCAGVCDCFVEVEAFWEEAGGGEEDGEVGEVGGDGGGDAGVLDFDGDGLAGGGEGGTVDLADGGGGDGGVGEGAEEGGPVGAEISGEDLVSLVGGHVVGVVLDTTEYFGYWCR